MKWNRFTIKTKTEAEDVIISALADVGVEGVEIQDKQPLTEKDKEQMFVDIMPEGPADDGIAYLNFYLEEDTEVEPVLERVRGVLEEAARISWTSARAPSPNPRLRTRTGSTTGRNFSISSMWMIS